MTSLRDFLESELQNAFADHMFDHLETAIKLLCRGCKHRIDNPASPASEQPDHDICLIESEEVLITQCFDKCLSQLGASEVLDTWDRAVGLAGLGWPAIYSKKHLRTWLANPDVRQGITTVLTRLLDS